MIDFTGFELRGTPLREWLIEEWKVNDLGWYLTHEPDHEVVTAFKRKLAYVNALPAERWALFPKKEVGSLLDPFAHTGKWSEIDPWIAWFNRYLPKAVPVPDGFEFRWLADYAGRADWCELSYLSPWEQLGIDRNSSLWTINRDNRPVDSYGSPPGSMKSDSPGFESTPYLQVGFWPDKGAFQTLDQGGQSWYAKATGLVQMPRVQGEIAMRLCNWAVDATGRRQDGEWSQRQRLGKGYPNEGRKHIEMWTLTTYSDTHPEWDERRRWVPADTTMHETATLLLADVEAPRAVSVMDRPAETAETAETLEHRFARPPLWTGKGKVQIGGGAYKRDRDYFTGLDVRIEGDDVVVSWKSRIAGTRKLTVSWQPMAGDQWVPSDGKPTGRVVVTIV